MIEIGADVDEVRPKDRNAERSIVTRKENRGEQVAHAWRGGGKLRGSHPHPAAGIANAYGEGVNPFCNIAHREHADAMDRRGRETAPGFTQDAFDCRFTIHCYG